MSRVSLLVSVPVVAGLGALGYWVLRTPRTSDLVPIGKVEDTAGGADRASTVDRAPEVGALREEVRVGSPLVSLVVDVVDDAGESVEGAQITAVGPADGSVAASGARADWTGLDPGGWTVRVEAEGCFPTTQVVALEAGKNRTLRIEIQRGGRITGTVQNHYGHGVRPWPVWLLRGDEVHPLNLAAGKTLASVRLSENGTFDTGLLAAGSYRLSVGPEGRAELTMDAPLELEPGRSRAVDIVVPARSGVRVVLEGLPPVDRPRSVEIEFQHPRGREIVEGERWKKAVRAKVPPDGVVFVDRLRPDTPHRLTVRTRDHDYVSKEIITVGPDVLVTIRARLESPDGRRGDIPLAVEVQTDDLDAALRPPGFYWR